MWLKEVAEVLVVEPSPKSQNRLVMVPEEESVKVTVKGLRPLVGVALKAAMGMTAPMPVTMLVLLPKAERKRTTLLKLPALGGVNWMVVTSVPNPGKPNSDEDRLLNGPALIATTPLSKGEPPWLKRVKLACALEPTAITPKSIEGGNVANCGGVKPFPVTLLVKLPPLLVKVTTLLKLPALFGAKVTFTKPVWPGFRPGLRRGQRMGVLR